MIKIVANVLNEDLFSYSRSFYENLEYEKIKISGAFGLFNLKFIDHVITHVDTDFAVLIDEDCFITKQSAFIDLINYVVENNIDAIGMPDGGSCLYRNFDPHSINPFFCILNVKHLKEKYNLHDVLNTSYDYDGEVEHEPYYKFFHWLIQNNFNIEYLAVNEFPIYPTVILKNHKGVEFAYHTWEARYWNEGLNHKRILNVIDHCNTIKS